MKVNPMHSMTRITFLIVAVLTALAALAFGEPAIAVGVTGMLLADGGGASIDELAALFNQKSQELGAVSAEFKTAQADMLERLKKGEELSAEYKQSYDELRVKFDALIVEFRDAEQKGAREFAKPENNRKTWGQQFLDVVKDKISGKERNQFFRAEVKAVDSTAAGGLIRSYRDPNVVSLTKDRLVIRDLIPTVPVNTSSVEYAVQTTRTNNAAPVAESAAKPYSDYVWSTATVVVQVIAHLAKITLQAMEDAPRLVAEIDAEMRYGLGLVEEAQILFGTGVSPQLDGIVPQATAFALPASYAGDTMATEIDVIRYAMLQISNANLQPDGVVINDTDWARIETLKDTTGRYLIGNPQGTTAPRLWALPVVASPAMTEGDFLVGAFAQSAVIYDRMSVQVLISTENADDFEKNRATMRAEERIAVAVKRPAGFVTGDFPTAIAAMVAAAGP
jgi:HK97 family phage major capsid protein